MISRERIVAFYLDLARQQGCAAPHEVIAALPPALCHALIRGEAGPEWSSDPVVSALGFDDPSAERYGHMLLSVRGFARDIQAALPLDGHRPVCVPGIVKWIRLALDELRGYNPEAWDYIQQWCSVIVWVERIPGRDDVTELTSTSIPKLPFATFVSKKLIRHIPPKHLMPAVNYYSIQENLFHEALHQQLAAFLTAEDILVQAPQEAPKVPIPWRDTEWPIDRALHAAWVYSGILQVRWRRLTASCGDETAFTTALAKTAEDGQLALSHLSEQLARQRRHFSDRGRDLIDRLAFAARETAGT